MTLQEFLLVCSGDEYVGIWDISKSLSDHKSRKRFEERPSEQSYFKIANIPYGRIRYFLNKEICGINHTEKGFLIRIHNKGEAEKHLDTVGLGESNNERGQDAEIPQRDSSDSVQCDQEPQRLCEQTL